MPKLTWKVAKSPDGSFVRRNVEGDSLGFDYIDVEWTHSEGFPEDHILVPLSRDEYVDGKITRTEEIKTIKVGRRDVITDQVVVPAGTPDSTVVMLLDEKAPKLAASLGISHRSALNEIFNLTSIDTRQLPRQEPFQSKE